MNMTTDTRSDRIGEVVLEMNNISLAFGGVKALTDISFSVREHEIRAIIGPNGAGKSSMLNVINGVYTPTQGNIRFDGKEFSRMNPRRAAEMGVARTFQNLALFKGMSVLDNIMTGRNLRMKSSIFAQALRLGSAEREEIRNREFVENIIDFLEIQAHRKTPVGRLPYGLQKRVDLDERFKEVRVAGESIAPHPNPLGAVAAKNKDGTTCPAASVTDDVLAGCAVGKGPQRRDQTGPVAIEGGEASREMASPPCGGTEEPREFRVTGSVDPL